MDNEKRMAGDYEIKTALFIGDGEVVIGENTKEGGCRFMMAVCHQNDLFAQYKVMRESDDYAEIVQSFGECVASQAKQVQEEVKALNIPTQVITKEDCISDRFELGKVDKRQTSSAMLIMDAMMELFDRIVDKSLTVRRINVTACKLEDESTVKNDPHYEQLDLLYHIGCLMQNST